MADAGGTVVHGLSRLVHAGNEIFGCGRGRLDAGVGHGIDDRVVALVADAGDDGQGELGAVGGQQIGVEVREVRRGASSADDDNDVPVVDVPVDAVEGGDDAPFHPLALHHGREQAGVEHVAVGVGRELVAEVAISGCGGRRDDCHALGQQGHGQLLVERQHALGLEPGQYLASAAGHVAQGVRRVDVGDDERIAIQLVEADRDLHHHLDAGDERLTRLLLEVGAQQAVRLAPYHGARLGYQVVAARVLLDELQVAVPRGVAAHVAQLGLHPVFVGESLFQPTAHEVVQFV